MAIFANKEGSADERVSFALFFISAALFIGICRGYIR
jgi:hypothetical protein